jgi:hypothetical protein
MNARTLGILAGVTLVLAGAAVLVTRSGSGPPSTTQDAPLVPDLGPKADAVARIVLRKDKKDTVIEKREGGWVVASKGGYPAGKAQAPDAIRALLDARVVEVKTSRPDLYSKLGVEDPDGEGATSTLLTLQGADGGPLASVIVGRKQWGQGPDDGTTTYVRRAGEAQSLQIKGEIRADADPMLWVDRAFGEVPQARVKSVTIRHGIADGVVPPNVVAVARATPEDKDFVLEGMPQGRKKKDEFVLTRVAGALAGVSFEDVAPADTVDTAAADAVTAEFRCFDGLKVTARLVKKDGKAWGVFEASFEPPPEPPAEPPPAPTPESTPPATPEAPAAVPAGPSEAVSKEIAELNGRWGGWVYQIPSWKADVLMSRLEDLLAPAEVTPTEPAPETPPGPEPSTLVPEPK